MRFDPVVFAGSRMKSMFAGKLNMTRQTEHDNWIWQTEYDNTGNDDNYEEEGLCCDSNDKKNWGSVIKNKQTNKN